MPSAQSLPHFTAAGAKISDTETAQLQIFLSIVQPITILLQPGTLHTIPQSSTMAATNAKAPSPTTSPPPAIKSEPISPKRAMKHESRTIKQEPGVDREPFIKQEMVKQEPHTIKQEPDIDQEPAVKQEPDLKPAAKTLKRRASCDAPGAGSRARGLEKSPSTANDIGTWFFSALTQLPPPPRMPFPTPIIVSRTAAYIQTLNKVCQTDIHRQTCKDPSTCFAIDKWHVCADFNDADCDHGGAGIIHTGGNHSDRGCNWTRQQNCGKPDCWQPNIINLFHTRYTCRATQEGNKCSEGRVGGSCQWGHDNADVRFRLASEYAAGLRN